MQGSFDLGERREGGMPRGLQINGWRSLDSLTLSANSIQLIWSYSLSPQPACQIHPQLSGLSNMVLPGPYLLLRPLLPPPHLRMAAEPQDRQTRSLC